MKQNETIISSGKSAFGYWKDLIKHRELFLILAKRDIMVRYKQSVLGISWSVIRPLLTAFVMVFAFGKIANLQQGSTIPYMLVVLPGVIIWLFFSQCLQQISSSIVGNANLVSKVYFPRLIIPFSSLLVGLVDAVIAFALYGVFCIYYQFLPNWHIFLAPFFLILAYLAALGVGLISAVLNVKFRDIAQIIPFVVQFGYFISPVAYTSERMMGSKYYFLYNLNPMAGIIDAFRWCLLGDYATFNQQSFIIALIFIAVILLISIRFFRNTENSFVDYI